MIFNLISHGRSFDVGSEVTIVAPLLMFAETMGYATDMSGLIIEATNPRPLTDELAIRLFKVYYPAATNPGVEKFDLVSILASIRKLKNIKNKSRMELIAMEKAKKVIRVVKEDVVRFNDNYMTQFGFHALKPFVENNQLLLSYGFGGDERRGSADTLNSISGGITAGENTFVLTQDFDKVTTVQILNGEKPQASTGIICFPFVSFPVLKRLTKEQLLVLRQSLSSAAEAFNRKFDEMQKKAEESIFNDESAGEFRSRAEEHFAPVRAELQKIIDDSIYIKQLRNSSPEDGEVHFYIGLSSVKNILDGYEKLGLYEPYVEDGILNRISTEGRTPDHALLFLYARSTGLEVNREVLKKFIPSLE